MSKKRKYLMTALLVLCVIAAVGGTVAFMFKKAQKKNTFQVAQVNCEVHEKMDRKEHKDAGDTKGNTKSDICVKNTGNIDEFVRIRLVSYYVDNNGNIAGRASSNYPDLKLKDGWIAGENYTYYYKEPVKANASTNILCEPIKLETKTLVNGTEVKQVIEVFAEAIQANPEKAAKEAWGVTVTDGKITNVTNVPTTP